MLAPSPDVKALHTLNALRGDAPFNTYLQDWKWRLVEALVATNDTDQISRLQGAIRAVDDLMKLVQTAPEQLARRKQ